MTISSKQWVLSYAGDRNKFGDPCTQNPSKPDERLPYLDSMNQLWYWVLFSWEHHRLDGLGKATSPGYFVRCSKPESFPKLSTKNTPAVQVWSLSEAEAYLNQAKVNGTMVALTQYLQSRGTVFWNRTLVRRAIDTSPKMRSVYDVSFPAVLYFGQFNDPLTSMVHNYCGSSSMAAWCRRIDSWCCGGKSAGCRRISPLFCWCEQDPQVFLFLAFRSVYTSSMPSGESTGSQLHCKGTLVRDFPVVATSRFQQTSDPLILAFPWSFGSIHHTLLFRCKTHTGEKDVVYWLLTLSLPCIIAGGKLARSMLVCFQVTYQRLLGNPLAWHLVCCPMIQFQDVILALTYAKATSQRNVSPKASSRFFPAIVLGPACCRQVSMTSCLSILCRFSLLCLNSRWWTCKLIGACQDRGLSQPMPLPWASLNYKSNQPQTTTLWVNVYCCLVSAWKDWMEKWASSPIDVQPPSGMAWNWLVVDMLLFGPVTWPSLLEVVLQILLPVSPPDLRVQLICQSHMKDERSYPGNPGELQLGQSVRLIGLSDANLNGQVGRVATTLTPAERYGVKMPCGRHIAVRPRNLKLVVNEIDGEDISVEKTLFRFPPGTAKPFTYWVSCCQDCVDACLRYSSNGNCLSSSDIAK